MVDQFQDKDISDSKKNVSPEHNEDLNLIGLCSSTENPNETDRQPAQGESYETAFPVADCGELNSMPALFRSAQPPTRAQIEAFIQSRGNSATPIGYADRDGSITRATPTLFRVNDTYHAHVTYGEDGRASSIDFCTRHRDRPSIYISYGNAALGRHSPYFVTTQTVDQDRGTWYR